MIKTDAVIVGSGIAGLTYALKLSSWFEQYYPEYKITIITKGDEQESNTNYAQGGVAVVWDTKKDSFTKHVEDTFRAGDGLCNREIVEMVVREGPARVKEMMEWGAEFDRTEKGDLDLGKEGGHTASRVIHHKDKTGKEIERILLEQIHKRDNIELLNHHFAIELITQHHLGMKVPKFGEGIECYGIYVMNSLTNKISKVLAKITVLATGGIGQVYNTTTNPSIATGDGIAMVHRAGGLTENMEFVQFHPTALYSPGERPSFLITEAVRGFGGILKTRDGNEFMNKYDDRGSLASRDIVARAIDTEMKKRGDDFVYLDCRHIKKTSFSERFPLIFEKCMKKRIDPSRIMIPVVPTAHYICGGIKTDENGKSSIINLFAIGECASTGLHGANRLASNSLLEALVFAHRAFEESTQTIKGLKFRDDIPDWNEEGTTEPREKVLITYKLKELRLLMSDYVSIVKTDKRLAEALKRLRILEEETENLYNIEILSPLLCELRNLITIAILITQAALNRRENRGLHYNIDLL